MVYLWLRRGYQITFFLLFLYLVLMTTAALIGGHPVEWFLGFDPLVAVSTALAAHSITTALAWAIPLVVLTLVLGRFFCGWICPMGTLHHLLGWLGRPRRVPDRVAVNLPRRAYHLPYFILAGMLVAALLGTNQIGLLDPIAFTWRAFATSLVPAIDNMAFGLYQGERHFHYSTVIIALFLAALALNLFIPRLYCRLLCPLGALLGLLARFSLFRLRKDPTACKDCNVCGANCQGAADPQGTLRVSECMLCLNCQVGCPRGGIRYELLPSPDLTTDALHLGRRRTLTALFSGLVAVPLMHVSDGSRARPDPRRIRPPGSLPEEGFLERCIKCGACMKACPTGGLQPAWQEAGFEGLWTPILVPRLGYCEHDCVLCTQVCPTGAIVELVHQEKVGRPPDVQPVRLGTAFFDHGRCLPWAMDTPCIVCEEVCPTSPKAIHFKLETVTTRHGERRTLERPYVDPTHCVGCGVCETHCPVYDKAAIRVASVGESRDVKNRIILEGGRV
jgi:MauM/NapG family ferredoxin protein